MTTVDRIARAIRQNPEGLLLLGAGVALMLRQAATANSTSPQRKRRKRADSYYDSTESGAATDDDGLTGKVAAAAGDVRSYVSGTAQDLTDKASEYGQAASKRTREVAGTAYRSTRDAADSAYRTVESTIDAHPVTIAVAGLAAGCLAAAVFPSTRFERDTLGPIGRRAAEAASETGEMVKSAAVARVTKAAVKAGEQIADRTFKTDNLGEVARDAASEFTSNLTDGDTKTGKRQADTRSAKAQL